MNLPRVWDSCGGSACLPRRGPTGNESARPAAVAGRARKGFRPSYSFTYSYSKGLPSMPLAGGAIQPAILPRSWQGFMSDCT